MDVASRHREQFLYNIYQMGRNAIKRGSEDTWTMYPKRIAEVKEAIAKDRPTETPGREGVRGGGAPIKYYDLLKKPEWRDPRGYIIPSDQPDFLTATKFVNALIKTGITIHRATAPFAVGGKNYPAGSYVVKAAQAFRPHLRDMLSRRTTRTTSPTPAVRRGRPTTSRATRWRSRWASSSTGFWTRLTGRSKSCPSAR